MLLFIFFFIAKIKIVEVIIIDFHIIFDVCGIKEFFYKVTFYFILSLNGFPFI